MVITSKYSSPPSPPELHTMLLINFDNRKVGIVDESAIGSSNLEAISMINLVYFIIIVPY